MAMSAVMNPGPRHEQNRAAMSAAIGGCPPGASLMAGMGCSQGEKEGGTMVEYTMEMLKSILKEAHPLDCKKLEKRWNRGYGIPGFGLIYGNRDLQAKRLYLLLTKERASLPMVSLLSSLEPYIAGERNEYMKIQGVFAALMADLGFRSDQGHGLYMIASSAGMLTHLCERYDEHWSQYPSWFREGEYIYEGFAKDE